MIMVVVAVPVWLAGTPGCLSDGGSQLKVSVLYLHACLCMQCVFMYVCVCMCVYACVCMHVCVCMCVYA